MTLRIMRACEKFGPSGEKMGSDPHFGAIWASLVIGKAHFLRAQHWARFQKTLLRCGDPLCVKRTLDSKMFRQKSLDYAVGAAEWGGFFSH